MATAIPPLPAITLSAPDPDATIVKSVGSIRIEPCDPSAADTSIAPVSEYPVLPETSTNPPLPPAGPPDATIWPAMLVCSVLNTVTVPPSPVVVARASTFAPLAMLTLFAVGATTDVPPVARASVVPTATVPPPAAPEAFTSAVGASDTDPVALISTAPPFVPAVTPAAATSPPIVSDPPTPRSTTVPVRLPTLSAAILPPASTSAPTIPSTAAAVSSTVPPSARITPLFVTSALTCCPSAPIGACPTCLVTSIDNSPSPYKSTVCVAAPASTTVPIRATIVPEFATAGATSAARPDCATLIVPALTIIAFGLPAVSNTSLPAMKFWFEISAVVTNTVCALTCAPWLNTTPDWFVSTIVPFAVICPAICDGSEPVTRFSVIALLLGWLNCTT